jgi:hypothetical protein
MLSKQATLEVYKKAINAYANNELIEVLFGVYFVSIQCDLVAYSNVQRNRNQSKSLITVDRGGSVSRSVGPRSQQPCKFTGSSRNMKSQGPTHNCIS